MATYRLKLSDGTTTIDLYGGSDSIVREGGLNMPPPQVQQSYVTNPSYDGARLATAKYNNRIITLNMRIWGSTLADLKTNIRSIQRLLNDAEKRTLRGYGDQVYLEYQWGDSVGESTYYDILRGDLAMPADYLNSNLGQYMIANATMTLTCKPLGRYTNQDITQDTLENFDYSTSHNYKDITTAEAYGDVPAKLYVKIAPNAYAGDKKIWIAKRSGDRYDDDLWVEGEDETSTTDIVTAPVVTFTDETDASQSGGKYKRADLSLGSVAAYADNEISRINFDFATPPRGQFRVLAYCRTTEISDNTEYANMAWGVGWSYGDKTKAPSEADGEYYSNTADNTWEILDLGLLNIPPVAESDIATNNTFQLRIYQYAKDNLTGSDATGTHPTSSNDPDTDWTDDDNIWDNDTGTKATCGFGGAGWKGYIEAIRAATVSSGLRFIANDENNFVDKVDIDAEYDGDWHVVANEVTFNQGVWVSKTFSDGLHSVTKYRLRFHATAADNAYLHEVEFLTPASNHRWDLDYIFLLPIDEGVVIVDSVGTTDIVAMDGITDPPNVFLINASNKITDYPTYVGAPFTLGRETTRIYLLRDDDKDVTFTVDIKYQPQFLVI